jgi:hypothetical protein
MNLVQINERLKDLPMQVVQQYANGMNPEVPPYLALGELQRRELSQKQMATAQGAQQGPQPSIKEQVEQKAGLMQLQQMQQQQMAQQQAQPRGPMPAPAGVPQPEDQPEAMMARGGLASIPVRSDMFEYAGGGIVAFQSGGDVDAARQGAKAARDKLMSYGLAQRKNDPEGFEEAKKAVEVAANRLKEAEAGYAKEMSAAGMDRPVQVSGMPQRPPQVTPPTEQASLRKMDARMAPAGLPGASQQMGTKTAVSTPSAAQRPVPTPVAEPQAGLPGAAAAMTPQDEVAKLALDAVREKAKAMTPEEVMAQEGKFASQYGLDKKFGEEERGLLALMKQRQAEQAQGRPMQELGSVLRGFGQGYGGASAAGERASRENYEMDMANQREMLNAINAINKENLVTGRERYKSGSGLFGKSEESAAAANRERTQTLGQMRNKDIDAETAAANRLNNIEVENLRIAERRAERNQPGSAAMVRADYLKMMDQVFALEDKGEKAQADALRRRADARLTASGTAGAAGVGAERNDISRMRLQIKTWENIRDNASDPTAIKEAEGKILQLARNIAKAESGEGGGKNEGAPLPENASAKNLVVGTVYQTAKGPAKWTGTGFMPI